MKVIAGQTAAPSEPSAMLPGKQGDRRARGESLSAGLFVRSTVQQIHRIPEWFGSEEALKPREINYEIKLEKT